MKTNLSYDSNRGFSLIELLITITILVIAASAVIPVFTFVTQANNQNKIRATANSIATSIFEEISSMKYEDIGTAAGSPAGIVETPREITVDGINYKVDILISWGSAADLGSENKTNPVAFKNIRVIVKATGAFTGTEDTVDKMYSIVAKEGQQSMPDKGNIRVLIKGATNVPLSTPSLNIVASGPRTYNMVTEGGQAIFGEIEKGTYSVAMPIPNGYYVPQNETVEAGNAVRKNIIIDNWSVKDVPFYIDRLENYSRLSVKLINETGEIVDKDGSITLTWNMDDTDYTVFTNKSFYGGTISSDNIGRLWPIGTYNIKISISDSDGYLEYDMDKSEVKPVIDGTETRWDGTFSKPGETINLLIPVDAIPQNTKRDAYSRIEAESYDEATGNYINNSNDGGQEIRGMPNNAYTVYKDVDFDTGARLFIARAAGNNNGTVTIRVDGVNGQIIGSLNFRSTGSNSNYQEQSCWINGITGVHDLYIFYSGGNFRFNWFTFRRTYDSDNFNDGNIADAWTFRNGTWQEVDGVLKQTSASEQDPKKAILSNGGFSETADYTITAKVRVDSWLGNNRIDDDMARAGVSLFTNTTDGEGYNLLFHRTDNKNVVQFLDDKRGWSEPVTGFSWNTGRWYWFKLKSEGTKLYGKIWLDGSSEPESWMFNWTTPYGQRTGYPALNGGSGDCRVWFDDISVTRE